MGISVFSYNFSRVAKVELFDQNKVAAWTWLMFKIPTERDRCDRREANIRSVSRLVGDSA